jgi:hypothetical protein
MFALINGYADLKGFQFRITKSSSTLGDYGDLTAPSGINKWRRFGREGGRKIAPMRGEFD